MRLSRRTEYGLRAVMQLAQLPGETYVQSREIAAQERLPKKFLESILLALKRGGFLESKIGSGGGYRLARPAGKITVGEIVRRLEGRLAAKEAAASADSSPGTMAVRLVNSRLTEATNRVLDGLTLEELVEQVNRLCDQSGIYYI